MTDRAVCRACINVPAQRRDRTNRRYRVSRDLAELDAVASAELVGKGEVTPAELVEAAVDRIQQVNGQLNAVIHPRYERAREEVAAMKPGPRFRGVPLLIK